jgi:hypothetical protein
LRPCFPLLEKNVDLFHPKYKDHEMEKYFKEYQIIVLKRLSILAIHLLSLPRHVIKNPDLQQL